MPPDLLASGSLIIIIAQEFNKLLGIFSTLCYTQRILLHITQLRHGETTIEPLPSNSNIIFYLAQIKFSLKKIEVDVGKCLVFAG
jgi:hypothetical protein